MPITACSAVGLEGGLRLDDPEAICVDRDQAPCVDTVPFLLEVMAIQMLPLALRRIRRGHEMFALVAYPSLPLPLPPVNPALLDDRVRPGEHFTMVTVTTLDSYLGKHIRDVCGNDYVNDGDNHCAHFVSHVLGLRFGATCHMMGKGKVPGANLRVQEVFGRCVKVGTWESRVATISDLPRVHHERGQREALRRA